MKRTELRTTTAPTLCGVWLITEDGYAALCQREMARVQAEAAGAWDREPFKIETQMVTGDSDGGDIAVIPITGSIVQGNSWCCQPSEIVREYDSAMDNDLVGGVMFLHDSPGGLSYGVPEAAEHIRSRREEKPVHAMANPFSASASYWLASAASHFSVTPSGDVGSIGVWSAHINVEKMLEEWGIEITLVSAGKYKVEGHPFGPLDDEAKAEMQRGVDEVFDDFETAVAKGRGTKRADVHRNFGQGRMVSAQRALSAGMVDSVANRTAAFATLQGAVAKAGKKKAPLRRYGAGRDLAILEANHG